MSEPDEYFEVFAHVLSNLLALHYVVLIRQNYNSWPFETTTTSIGKRREDLRRQTRDRLSRV